MTERRSARRGRKERWRAPERPRPTVPLRRHGALVPDDPADVLVTASIGPDGEAVALWTGGEDAAATAARRESAGASFPEPRTPRPVPARVTVHGGEAARTVPIAELSLAHPTVQPLPDGRVLVVAARCRWRPAGPDRNAVVYDSDGRVVGAHTFGDGIAHVLADRTGHVWVGYFDEGVFGNYGWGDPGAPPPVGDVGLLRFSPSLEVDWSFPVDDAYEPISDCYALNVSDEGVWTCYYTEFPLVRVRAGRLSAWRNKISGAQAVVAGGGVVGLYGGYGTDRDRLVVASLDRGRLVDAREFRLVLPDGAPVPAAARAFGRGRDLHVVDGRDWYRLDLDHLRAR